MSHPVGIKAIAVSFPSTIRTNEYWQEKFPDLLAQEKPRKPRLSQTSQVTSHNDNLHIWSEAVAPYLSDPFRGNIERRVLAPEESSLMLEYRAAKDALAAANLTPDDIGLMIVTSLFGEQVGPGSASYLAQQLQLQCPAWHLESTCSSALVALQNAHALIEIGAYRHILVVISQIGSRTVAPEDTLSWSMGDGAGAFLVDILAPNQGILSTKIVDTNITYGAYIHELINDAQGKPWIRTRTGDNMNALAETSVDFVRRCCQEAVKAADLTLEQIDFFAFNTPTPWYSHLCVRALRIDPQRTINLYPQYANIGAVSPIANLYHATQAGQIQENDLVLVYTNGASATAAATVMRWGQVVLGPPPTPPIHLSNQLERVHPPESTAKYFLAENSCVSRDKILSAPPQAQQQMLETYLLKWFADSLQLPQEQLNSQQSIAYLLDSLTTFALKNQIAIDLQIQVPMAKLCGEQNISRIAEMLLQQLVLSELLTTNIVENQERDKISL